MLTTILTSLALLTTLTSATPIEALKRAGGPAIVPITSPCYLSYPINAVANATAAYRPGVDIATTQTYTWDRPASDGAYYNASTLWTQCIEQCNGLSGCKAAFFAYDVPAEPRYGLPGGTPGIACRMFNVFLDAADFVPVDNGTYTQAVAANIDGCGK